MTRLSDFRIKDKQSQIPMVTRSKRNEWVETIEEKVRNASPFPISYDVDSTQDANFQEFSYTEFLGGMIINTQSVEINTRLIQYFSTYESNIDCIDKLIKNNCLTDKYVLAPNMHSSYPENIGIMVGHNMFDLVSSEIVARLAFELPDFKIKLHPLTNQEYAAKVASIVGWDKIIQSNFSGVELIKNCKVAYLHTATELAAMAVALDKKIVNISNFFNESGGSYYHINSTLFKSADPKKTLNSILSCPNSGFLFPYMDESEIDSRISNYFKCALKFREMFSPIASKSRLKKTPN